MSNNPYYDQDVEFVTGFAGSGKSTELVKRANEHTLVLVPTHKAADVLIGKGLVNVYTIYAVLKLVPTINDNFRGSLKTKLRKVGKTNLEDIENIFIDEFSMINQDILDMLLSALPEKAKVTVFGDPYQLPPVTGDPILLFDPITELTTQHRSKAPRTTNLFMKCKEFIDGTRRTMPQLPNVDLEWLDEFDPDQDRVVAYTNKRVMELNNTIAEHLGVPETFQVGETLTMNGIYCEMVDEPATHMIFPTCVSKGSLMPPTKLVNTSAKTSADIAKYRTNLNMYKTINVMIDDYDSTYEIYYDPDHYETEKRLKKSVEKFQALVINTHNLSAEENIPKWCANNRNAQYVFERGKAWSKYLAHKNYVFNVSRPYATTVHKSQGSEFRYIFVDAQDINSAWDEMTRARLMYVSLSRGIDGAILI